jgi:hypothetical protein
LSRFKKSEANDEVILGKFTKQLNSSRYDGEFASVVDDTEFLFIC